MRNTKEELATVIFMLLDDEIWWTMMNYDILSYNWVQQKYIIYGHLWYNSIVITA